MKTITGFLLSIIIVALFPPFLIGREFMVSLLWSFSGSLLVVGLVSLFTAVPLYLVLKNKNLHTLKNLSISSFLIGFISICLIILLFKGDYTQVSNTILISNGSLTLSGWSSVLKISFLMGCVSIIGSIIFWAVAVRGTPNKSLKSDAESGAA